MNLRLLGILVIAWVGTSHGAPTEEEEPCGVPADIVFILDSSRSIAKDDFTIEKEFVANLVGQFDIGPAQTQVAALQFARDSTVEVNLTDFSNSEDLINKVLGIEQSFGGATYTDKALGSLLQLFNDPKSGARPGVPKIAILLSDGASTNPRMTKETAAAAKAAGITLLAIGIGNVNKAELEHLVTAPNTTNFFYKTDFDELKNVKFQHTVGSQACAVITTTTVEPTTESTTAPTTPIETTTRQASTPGMIQDRPDAEEKCQGKAADVVFVLDMSSSIWRYDFEAQLDFVTTIVDMFDIDTGKTQVGAIVFSDNATVVFDMDKYRSKPDIVKAVLGVKSEGGITNTHKALELAIDHSFNPEFGSRKGVAHICILITDGRSSVPEETLKMAKKFHDRNIYIFAIGVGNMTDTKELAEMASQPTSEFMFEVNGYKALPQIQSKLAYKTCEVPQGDQPPCAKDLTATLTFGMFNIGGDDRARVSNFISSVGGAVDLTKVKIGLVESCGNANFDVTDFTSTEEFDYVVKDSMATGIKDLFLSVRRSFARNDPNQVAVLFVSGDAADMKVAEAEALRLRRFSRVVIVVVGEATAQVKELELLTGAQNKFQGPGHMLRLDDSFSVNRFLKLLCKAQ